MGVTAKPEDPQDLAFAIKKLFMKPPQERVKMSQNGRKIAEKIYAIDAASSNGTFENDNKIRVTELKSDKTLVLGSFGTMLRWKPV